MYALWFGLPSDSAKIEASLDQMEHNRPQYNSTYSYFAEVFTLTAAVEWVRLSALPVGPNEIAVEHRGAMATVFTDLTVRAGETRTAKLS